MKLALIPPHDLSFCQVTDYRLILPSSYDNEDHAYAVMRTRRRPGSFLMLDNGIAEGEAYPAKELFAQATQFMANEIVLPDVIGDWLGTMTAVGHFSEYVDMDGPFGFMGVIQGKNVPELCDMVSFYLDLPYVTSIGIPRHLITSLEGGECPDIRLIMAKHIRSQRSHIDIHLLGLNTHCINEMQLFGADYRTLSVRGVDTSAPFVYAAQGLWIGDDISCPRPEGYFDMSRHQMPEKILNMNIDTLTRWTHG
jgi:hypothetical protein